VETVDSVDKVKVEKCLHSQSAVLWWIENRVGYPPSLRFINLPTSGLITMSKAVILIQCSACAYPAGLPRSTC